MNEKELEDFVENFKGMLWDELDDCLGTMSREDSNSCYCKIKKKVRLIITHFYFFLNNQ